VDEHAVVRECVKRMVECEPDMMVIAEAGSEREALERAKNLCPGIVLMDVAIGQLTVAEMTRELAARCPGTKLLVFTENENRATIRDLFDAGISGYLLKRSPAEKLACAIRMIASGGMYFDASLAEVVKEPQRSRNELSDVERDVMRYIAEGYILKEIAEKLDLSVKTVEGHKRRCMLKLRFRSRVDIIRYATRCGWVGVVGSPPQ
jgi:DNA-binding NarL/FixJ family response regulator